MHVLLHVTITLSVMLHACNKHGKCPKSLHVQHILDMHVTWPHVVTSKVHVTCMLHAQLYFVRYAACGFVPACLVFVPIHTWPWCYLHIIIRSLWLHDLDSCARVYHTYRGILWGWYSCSKHACRCMFLLVSLFRCIKLWTLPVAHAANLKYNLTRGHWARS